MVHIINFPLNVFTSVPYLISIHLFIMNKPGQDVSNLQGGVSEGSILEELLRARYGIKLWPGIFNKANGVKWD